jgi:hypothetical protein
MGLNSDVRRSIFTPSFFCESLEVRRLMFSTPVYMNDHAYAAIYDPTTAAWTEDTQLPYGGQDGSYQLHLGNLPDHKSVTVSFGGEANFSTEDDNTEKVKLSAGGVTDEWDFTTESSLDFGVGGSFDHTGNSLDITLTFENFGDGEEWTLWNGDTTVHRPTVSVTATDPRASENYRDPATFTISLDDVRAVPTEVNYTLAGSATEGTDYEAPSVHKATIPAYEHSADVTLTPLNDADNDEGVETIVINLQGGDYYGNPGTNPATAPATAQADLHPLKMELDPAAPTADQVNAKVQLLESDNFQEREGAKFDLGDWERNYTELVDPILEACLANAGVEAEQALHEILTPVKTILSGNKINISLRPWGADDYSLNAGEQIRVSVDFDGVQVNGPPPPAATFTAWNGSIPEITLEPLTAGHFAVTVTVEIFNPNTGTVRTTIRSVIEPYAVEK